MWRVCKSSKMNHPGVSRGLCPPDQIAPLMKMYAQHSQYFVRIKRRVQKPTCEFVSVICYVVSEKIADIPSDSSYSFKHGISVFRWQKLILEIISQLLLKTICFANTITICTLTDTHLHSWVKRSNYSKVPCSRTQTPRSRPGFEPTFWCLGHRNTSPMHSTVVPQ